MSKYTRSWLPRAAAGMVAGLALGFAVGWGLWPVEYTNTSPDVLRQDYLDDYVVMIATAYSVDGDLTEARSRLAQVDSEDPSAVAQDLVERLDDANGNVADITHLVRLTQALAASGADPAVLPVEKSP